MYIIKICKQNGDGEPVCIIKGRKHSMKLRNKSVLDKKGGAVSQCNIQVKHSKQIHGCQDDTTHDQHDPDRDSRRAGTRQFRQGCKGEQLTRKHTKSK